MPHRFRRNGPYAPTAEEKAKFLRTLTTSTIILIALTLVAALAAGFWLEGMREARELRL